MKTKKPSSNSSSDLRCRKSLVRPKRIILKFTNKNNNNEEEEPQITQRFIIDYCTRLEGFENSHSSSWFRGPLLGKGGFGSVYLAQINSHSQQLPPHTLIAVKSSFLKDSSSLRFEKRVFDDLKSCSSVVRFYGHEITTTTSGSQVYNLLLEYCSRGSLHDRIANFRPNNGGLPELEVRQYTRDIVYGIAFIHDHGYIHCDIKPSNILLRPSVDSRGRLVAKITDFGLAMKITNVVTIDDDLIRGTKLYMAPETLKDSYIDRHVDIWALGCVVLEMLIGKRVWSTSKTLDLDHLSPEILSGLSPMTIDFLRRCLMRNPYKRSSAWWLLGHPFISHIS